jgi:hypothetical protein
LGERDVRNVEVGGSIPLPSTTPAALLKVILILSKQEKRRKSLFVVRLPSPLEY